MPKIVDRDRYRKELLNKCFDLFAEKGYASITMREIAEGIGVSTGTLYHYFPGKETLFEQMVEEMTQRDILQARTELENIPTLVARTKAIFHFFAKDEEYFFKQTLVWMDFYQQQGQEKFKVNSLVRKINDQVREAIADILGVEDPQLAIFVSSFINGLIQERLFDDRISFSKQGELLGEMLTAYLEKKQ